MLSRYILPTIILVALVGVVAYLSFRVASDYFKPREYKELFAEYFSSEPAPFDPAKIEKRIAYLRDSKGYLGGLDSQMMLFEQLVKQAWYYPDKTSESLQEAIPLGIAKYRQEPVWREYLGPQLAFAYLYAGLPTAELAWHPEASAQAPNDFYRLKLMQMSAFVALDDLDGARSAADEATSDELAVQGRAFQIAAGILLNREGGLEDYHIAPARAKALPFTLRWYYAVYLLKKGDFPDAADQYALLLREAPGDPDLSLELAAALMGTGETDQGRIDELLAAASTTTREPMSQAGARAMCLYILTDADPGSGWWDELKGLGSENQDDFVVASAIADASLKMHREPNGAVKGQEAGSTPDYVIYSTKALDLAAECWQLQSANLALAIAYSQWWLDSGRDDCLQGSLDHLMNALGSGSGPDPVEPLRIPEYDYFLLDEGVQTARKSDAGFDASVHQAVLDFLSRVRDKWPEATRVPEIQAQPKA